MSAVSLRIAEQRGADRVVIEVRDHVSIRTSFDQKRLVSIPADDIVTWSTHACDVGYVCIVLQSATAQFRLCLSQQSAALAERVLAQCVH